MKDSLGFGLNHDDTDSDRSEGLLLLNLDLDLLEALLFIIVGGKLNNGNIETSMLWNLEFSVPFARPGSMYRGNSSYGKLMRLDESYSEQILSSLSMDVKLKEIKVNWRETCIVMNYTKY